MEQWNNGKRLKFKKVKLGPNFLIAIGFYQYSRIPIFQYSISFFEWEDD